MLNPDTCMRIFCLPLNPQTLLASLALSLTPTSLPAQANAPVLAVPASSKAEKPPILFVSSNYEMEDALPGLSFEQPLGIVNAPGDQKRLFILEKNGRVQVVTGLEENKPQKRLFLDLTHPRDGALETDGECGVLGLAFPPDHLESGRFFVYYSLKIKGKLQERLSRFHTLPNQPDTADGASEQPLFTQADQASNHNGGDLHFGPDGCLYISVGDEGGGGDQFNNARFINKGFHAAILRIDVDKKMGSLPPNPHPGIARDATGKAFYAIPQDNPFIGATSHHSLPIDPKTVRTEIWATGLRNPWRFSFDSATGRLFAGDVGQNLYEEVDLITKGGDYGWSYREGLHTFPQGPGGAKEPENFSPIQPIFEYPRPIGLCVIGGVVYHGNRFPQHRDKYIFADFGTGRVMALHDEGKAIWADETLAQEPGIASIGLDPRNGEILFANYGLGKIKSLKLKANPTLPRS